MTTETIRDDLQQIARLAVLSIEHPYRALHQVFPFALTAGPRTPVRAAAITLITIRVTRLERQPLPRQRHVDSNIRLWTHWREEAVKVDDSEVIALTDRALASIRLYDPAKSPYDYDISHIKE
jgi:hypothetical protein